MLLSNNPAISRIGPYKFQVSNIYNMKSFTNKLKPIILKRELEVSELMFTQWEESPQPFPKVHHHSSGISLGQRDSFIASKIYKKNGVFFLRVADNWFVQYDGSDMSLVESDYQRLRLFIYSRVKKNMELQAKLISVQEGKGRKTSRKPRRAKLRINRGKKLVEIAQSKCNKKNVNRKKC